METNKILDNPNRLAPRDRYVRDPAFTLLVDALIAHIKLANYTPTELREALILAVMLVEETTLPRHYIMQAEPGGYGTKF